MPKIGPLELVIILVIVLMIFGLGRLPQVGSAIGKAVRSVRNSQTDDGVERTVKQASGTIKG